MARPLGNCLAIENLARFSALLGYSRLKEIMMTARLMTEGKALSSGVVSEVLPDWASLRVRAMELAKSIASAPVTLQVTKEGLRRLRTSNREVDGSDLILSRLWLAGSGRGCPPFSPSARPNGQATDWMELRGREWEPAKLMSADGLRSLYGVLRVAKSL